MNPDLEHGRDPNWWRHGGKNENGPYYFKNIPIYVRASAAANYVGAV